MKLNDMTIFLAGEIKVNKRKDYGYFTMDTEKVRDKLDKPLEVIKQNMQEKA